MRLEVGRLARALPNKQGTLKTSMLKFPKSLRWTVLTFMLSLCVADTLAQHVPGRGGFRQGGGPSTGHSGGISGGSSGGGSSNPEYVIKIPCGFLQDSAPCLSRAQKEAANLLAKVYFESYIASAINKGKEYRYITLRIKFSTFGGVDKEFRFLQEVERRAISIVSARMMAEASAASTASGSDGELIKKWARNAHADAEANVNWRFEYGWVTDEATFDLISTQYDVLEKLVLCQKAADPRQLSTCTGKYSP